MILHDTARRRHILVVDDDVDCAYLLARFLSRGHEVMVAHDGPSALEAALASPPALIVSDVMMPGLDGFEMVRRLRTIAGIPHVPVIFLSARGRSTDIIEGIQAGAYHYLTKPVRLDALTAKVNAALGVSSIPPPRPSEEPQIAREALHVIGSSE